MSWEGRAGKGPVALQSGPRLNHCFVRTEPLKEIQTAFKIRCGDTELRHAVTSGLMAHALGLPEGHVRGRRKPPLWEMPPGRAGRGPEVGREGRWAYTVY